MNFSIFHHLPLWLDFLIFLVLLMASLELGYRGGVAQRKEWKSSSAGGGDLVQNSMFGVLGLLLAFTFGWGLSHHTARKDAVVAEANAIGTAYLRAGLVSEPGRTNLRTALRDYTRTRTVDVGKALAPDELAEIIEISMAKKAKLWPITEEIVRTSTRGPVEASLVAAVNGVIDSDTARLAAVVDTLPSVVLFMLVFIAATTSGVAGFNAGIVGRMSRWRMGTLALVLSTIILVILDFDRPLDGFICVRQESITTLLKEIGAESAP